MNLSTHFRTGVLAFFGLSYLGFGILNVSPQFGLSAPRSVFKDLLIDREQRSFIIGIWGLFGGELLFTALILLYCAFICKSETTRTACLYFRLVAEIIGHFSAHYIGSKQLELPEEVREEHSTALTMSYFFIPLILIAVLVSDHFDHKDKHH